MENDEDRQAEVMRVAQEMQEQHETEADRKTKEIIEKLDIQALNAGINKTVNPTSLEAAQSMRIKMTERYSVGWSDPRKFTIAQAKPDYNITLNNTVDGKQVQIGKLDFNGAMMKFDGNADASAIVFMDSLAQTFKGRLEAEHVNAAKLLLELVTFKLEGEMELDSAYRKGFNDGMATCRAVLRKKIQEMERK